MSDTRAVGVYSPPLRLTGRLLDGWRPPAVSEADEALLAGAAWATKAERASAPERAQTQPDVRAPAPGPAR